MGRLRDVFNLLRGRSVLESGGRTLDLDKLAFEYESPLSGGTYWLRRDSGTTDLDGKRVAPIFTTEDAARRWPGDGEPVEAQGALLAQAFVFGDIEAAAVDPSSLEVLRRGPHAPDASARWIRFPPPS